MAWRYGFKFLSPLGSTTYQDKETIYYLPQPNQKWSEWTVHPSPATPDGQECGAGRFHVMKILSNPHGQYSGGWWPWYARFDNADIVGEGDDKVGVTRLQLRCVPAKEFWKMIRLGWARGADLEGADLEGADLRGANLQHTDLGGANLQHTDLGGADLGGTNLEGANLRGANLRGALNYRNAYMSEEQLALFDEANK